MPVVNTNTTSSSYHHYHHRHQQQVSAVGQLVVVVVAVVRMVGLWYLVPDGGRWSLVQSLPLSMYVLGLASLEHLSRSSFPQFLY